MRHPLFPLFLFLGAVLLEIFGFAWVGGAVGALTTVVLVVVTAAVGLLIFRIQGFAHWRRMQELLARGELPARELLEAWLLVVAAVLLLVPGFFSDAIGFALLVPPLRASAAAGLLRRRAVWTSAGGQSASADTETIEGEFRKRDNDHLTDRHDR
ncbi:FxsA family protein [Thioalkalivibrio sp.]|uniref:FxsA family protein n=1 Tax=Thioalkalivibrio sp. TaxID=2093813 RepID=UPI00356B24DA